jgi:hypothetical protein
LYYQFIICLSTVVPAAPSFFREISKKRPAIVRALCLAMEESIAEDPVRSTPESAKDEARKEDTEEE